MGAVSGLLAVGICLIWAWNSHEARNYYMFGFLTNAFYIVLLAISLMVRVPGLGLVIEFIRTLPTEHLRAWLADWRGDKALNRAYTIITALWIGVFSLRLVVQVPLYLSNQVGWLGTARLLMGIPFWALAIWVSYLIVATPMHRHKTLAESKRRRDGRQQRNGGTALMESTIRIERYADQGRCVGHIDGRVVFVRFALPGELVRVVLDEPHDREDPVFGLAK